MSKDYDLYLGDCLELMKDIPDGSVDMILCDLPYGTTRNKWDSVISFEALWKQYERIIKDNGAIVLFSQSPFDKALAMSNIKLFRYEWIWEKTQGTGHLNAKRMPMKIHENILVFYRSLPTYNPQWGKGTPYVAMNGKHSSNYGKQRGSITTVSDGKRYPTDILRFGKQSGDQSLHPTQKPVALLEYLVRTYTNPGEIILDNCMGSGSTGVACVNTGRRFIGMELDEQYFTIAQNRIRDAAERVKTVGSA